MNQHPVTPVKWCQFHQLFRAAAGRHHNGSASLGNLPPSALIKGTLKTQPAKAELLILILGRWADHAGFSPNSL